MKLKVPLYDFQREIVARAVRQRYLLNGCQMGLGKTAQALALACAVDSPRTLILCPAFLRLNWRAEIGKFVGDEHQGRFDVVSYDSVYKIESFAGYTLVIADEVHYAKSMGAKRTQALHTRMAEHPPTYFMGLSGTPVKNNVPEFYSLLRLCWYGGTYPEFDRYAQGGQWVFNRDFTHERRLKLGGRKFTKWEGVKDPEALRELVRPVYVRRRTKDVISLPDQIRREIVVAEKAESDAALEGAWESYRGGKDKKSFSSGKAVSALAKVPFTAELVKEALAEGLGPIVVFTDHVQSARSLYQEFPKGQVITGETSMPERNAIVNLLNQGKVDVLVATIGSLSVGVNLTACNRVVFNDIGWVPADVDQAEARIHRIGQKRTCFYDFVLASRYDQVIYRTIRKKRELIAEVGT